MRTVVRRQSGGTRGSYGIVGHNPPLPAESPPPCSCGTAHMDAPGQDEDQVHEYKPGHEPLT